MRLNPTSLLIAATLLIHPACGSDSGAPGGPLDAQEDGSRPPSDSASAETAVDSSQDARGSPDTWKPPDSLQETTPDLSLDTPPDTPGDSHAELAQDTAWETGPGDTDAWPDTEAPDLQDLVPADADVSVPDLPQEATPDSFETWDCIPPCEPGEAASGFALTSGGAFLSGSGISATCSLPGPVFALELTSANYSASLEATP